MLSEPILQRLGRLTPKERACLLLVARRLSSKAIAAELGIAKTSVDTYCNRARSKLDVADRYEAARLVLAQAQMLAPASIGPTESAPGAEPPQGALVNRAAVSWLFIAVGALIGVLAVASLVSGMSALDQMKDPMSGHRHAASPPPPHPS
jgi:DNA-binding CsgD family transcriptional regulator